jgi:hypothetical protein
VPGSSFGISREDCYDNAQEQATDWTGVDRGKSLFSSNHENGQESEKEDWNQIIRESVLSGDKFETFELPTRQIIIADWFYEGDCGFVFAPCGLGKTWFNLGLGLAVAAAGSFGPYKAQVDWPVLYVDGEMPFDTMRDRIKAIHGSIPEKFHILSHEVLFRFKEKNLNLGRELLREALRQYCVSIGIRLLILDNLSCLFSGIKENEAGAWEPVKQWLLTLPRLRIAVIVVHHTGRNPGHMRGTTAREDDIFWAIQLAEPTDKKISQPGGTRFITNFTKQRNSATQPISYTWVIEPQGSKVSISFNKTSGDDIIVGWVQDGLSSPSDIAVEMDLTKGTVSKHMTRLVNEGRLEKRGRSFVLGPLETGKFARDWTQ